MTTDIATLNPAILDDARNAGGWQLAQLNLSGNTDEGIRRAGLPKTGRILVIVGYEGCATHDFAALEKQAKALNAKLYVIDGYTTGPAAQLPNYKPQINISERDTTGKRTNRPLDGTIIAPRHPDGKLMQPNEIRELASQLGMATTVSSSGVSAISSLGGTAGIKLFENGKPIDYMKKAELPFRRGAYAVG